MDDCDGEKVLVGVFVEGRQKEEGANIVKLFWKSSRTRMLLLPSLSLFLSLSLWDLSELRTNPMFYQFCIIESVSNYNGKEDSNLGGLENTKRFLVEPIYLILLTII